jgi:Tfp pilus assembly protein PilF
VRRGSLVLIRRGFYLARLGASYMEVAMKISYLSPRVGLLILCTCLFISACLLAGCAEPLTYSQDFKRDGLRQFNSGEYVNAAGSFKAAAKQNPTDYQTQFYLGLSYERTGDFQLAVESYKLCLKLRTQMPAGRADVAMREKVINRLAALIAHGNFVEPEINAIAQDAQTDKSSDEYRLLAHIFALRGDADSAVTAYRQALIYSDNDFALTKEYGLYLVKIDQTAEGTRILKTAWQMNPSDRQVVQTLRQLGVTDAQLIVRSDRIEEQAADTSTPKTAWDVATEPKD